MFGHNTQVVMLGVMLLGAASALVGTFTLLRRRALLSDALSHATLPGIALAWLVLTFAGLPAKNLPALLTGAMVTALAGVFAVNWIKRHTRVSSDAAIGIVLASFYGFGVVLLSYIQQINTGSPAGLELFIIGQAATMTAPDARLIASISLLCLGVSVLLFKELKLLCFDSEFMQGAGWPVHRVDLALSALTVLVVVVGLQVVGLVLSIALLIIPPVTARFWSDRMSVNAVISVSIGAISCLLGALWSAFADNLPTGATIIVIAGAMFVFSLLLSPRGLIAQFWRQRRQQLDWQILLVLIDAGGNNHAGQGRVPIGGSASESGGEPVPDSPGAAWRKLHQAGLAEVVEGGYRLTEAGRQSASERHQNLALWRQASLMGIVGETGRQVRWGLDDITKALGSAELAQVTRALEIPAVESRPGRKAT